MRVEVISRWREAILNGARNAPKYELLAEAMAEQIEAGHLSVGEKLPTHRDLAYELGVSVQTISAAYRVAERRGLIHGQVGRGTYVSYAQTARASAYMLDHAEQQVADLSTVSIVQLKDHPAQLAEILRDLAGSAASPWTSECRPVAGFQHHREAGAEWLKSLGLPARPQDILITDGASQAVFVALATVARASDVVATAALTDHGAIAAAHLLGCNVKGLPTDEFGIIGECFEQLCKVNPIKALIVTPNLNNPTVSLMPMERRVEISRIAQMYGVFIIEDDVYGPLVDGAPPPISALAPELGLYCTSFTKSVMTGLRTGYLAVPRKLFLRAESVLRVATWMATPLVAEIGCRWVLDGTARRLVEGQRKAIAPRYQALRDILGSHLLGSHSNALSAWVSVPEPWTVDRIIAEARRLNIAITAPDPFIVDYDARPNAFRLCIGGGIQIANLQTALRRISELLVQHPVIHDIV